MAVSPPIFVFGDFFGTEGNSARIPKKAEKCRIEKTVRFRCPGCILILSDKIKRRVSRRRKDGKCDERREKKQSGAAQAGSYSCGGMRGDDLFPGVLLCGLQYGADEDVSECSRRGDSQRCGASENRRNASDGDAYQVFQ